ncbi:segregation/condensation protein A [bacterium]|nr:segregation/condensation protein A [bacterium]
MEIAGSAYKVQLAQFEGPLDLLLHLVQSAKLSLTEISLAQVAHQYFVYIENMPQLDVEAESSYLVVFAQLLELKSRKLLPYEAEEEDSACADSPGIWGEYGEAAEKSLIKKLADYAVIKDAAVWLSRREEHSLSCYPRPLPMTAGGPPELEADLNALVRTMRRLERTSRAPRKPVSVAKAVLSVPERIEQLWQILSGRSQASFADLLGSSPTRDLLIVTFLALLELAKERKIILSQEKTAGEICIRKVCENDRQLE